MQKTLEIMLNFRGKIPQFDATLSPARRQFSFHVNRRQCGYQLSNERKSNQDVWHSDRACGVRADGHTCGSIDGVVSERVSFTTKSLLLWVQPAIRFNIVIARWSASSSSEEGERIMHPPAMATTPLPPRVCLSFEIGLIIGVAFFLSFV